MSEDNLFADVIKVEDPVQPETPPDPKVEALKVFRQGIVDQLSDMATYLIDRTNWLVGRVGNPSTNGIEITIEEGIDVLGNNSGMLLAFNQKILELIGMVAQLQGISQEQVMAKFIPPPAGITYSVDETGKLIVTRSEQESEDTPQ